MYAAYIQLHFRLLLILETNTINPDQGSSLISVRIVYNMHKQIGEQ